MIKIRKATLSDSVSLSLLGRVTYIQSHEVYFDHKNDMIEYCDKEYSVSNTEYQLQDPNTLYLMAFVNELPVGYAMLKLNEYSPILNSSDTCQIQKIYVLNDFTSQKIGHRLNNAIIEEVQSKKLKHVWLTTYIKNSKAINFYIKKGYKNIGVDQFMVNDINYEQIVFSRNLNK